MPRWRSSLARCRERPRSLRTMLGRYWLLDDRQGFYNLARVRVQKTGWESRRRQLFQGQLVPLLSARYGITFTIPQHSGRLTWRSVIPIRRRPDRWILPTPPPTSSIAPDLTNSVFRARDGAPCRRGEGLAPIGHGAIWRGLRH